MEKKMSDLLAGIQARFEKPGKEKLPPHELAATVDLIKTAGLIKEPTYGYNYWLGKVKRAGVSYTDMIGILKNLQSMDSKYSKGGTLTNILTKLATQRKKL